MDEAAAALIGGIGGGMAGGLLALLATYFQRRGDRHAAREGAAQECVAELLAAAYVLQVQCGIFRARRRALFGAERANLEFGAALSALLGDVVRAHARLFTSDPRP